MTYFEVPRHPSRKVAKYNGRETGFTANVPPDTIRGQSTLCHEMMNRDPMVKNPSTTGFSEGMKCERGVNILVNRNLLLSGYRICKWYEYAIDPRDEKQRLMFICRKAFEHVF